MKEKCKRLLAVVLAMILVFSATESVAFAKGSSARNTRGGKTSVNKNMETSPSEEVKTPESGIPAEDQEPEEDLSEEAAPEEAAPEEGVVEETTPEAAAEETAVEETAVEENAPAASAQDFSGEENGVKVTVNAPEGAFPAGTVMTVSEADEEAVQAAADAVDADASNVKAVDITFSVDGEEIEPAVPISVKLETELVAAAEEAAIVHVKDDAQTEVIEETSVEGEAISFEAEAFSVYAIVGKDENGQDIVDARYTVQFYSGSGMEENEIYEKQIIKAGESLVQPAQPDVLEGYDVFVGWYVGGKGFETGLDNPVVWEGGTELEFGVALNAGTLEMLDKTETNMDEPGEADHIIKVHARYAFAYKITFYDSYDQYQKYLKDLEDENVAEEDKASMPGVVTIELVNTNGTFDIGSVTTTPDAPEDNQVFAGWVDENNTPVSGVIANIRGDMALYANFDKGYSLVFDSNADDATVTATQYIIEGNKPGIPANPTRPGYQFAGWYTEKDGGTVYNFGTSLRENTTVYAHWDATTTNYTVVIWHQSIDDDKNAEDAEKTYDYETYYTASATTGAAVTASMATAAMVTDEEGTTSTINCTTLSYTGFKYRAWDSEDEAVAADGSTIINVYYDRQLITMTFTGLGNNVTYSQNNNATNMYGMYARTGSGGNYQYYALTRNGSDKNYTWTYVNSSGITTTYTGNRYTASGGTTMTGLYGQTLAQNDYTWPSTNNVGQAVNWVYTRSDNNKDMTATFKDSFMFASGDTNVTFTAYAAVGRTINFYLEEVNNSADEDAEKVWPTSPSDTITTSSTTANYNIADSYTGFHAYEYRTKATENGNWTEWSSLSDPDTNGYYATLDLDDYYSIEIHFARNEYKITFYNGEYSEDYWITYGTDISANEPTEENGGLSMDKVPYPGEDKTEAQYYYLAGWYANQEGTVEFNWDRTMPANNLMVYAVFKPNTYTVTYDAAGGSWSNGDTKVTVNAAYKSRLTAPPSPNLKDHVFLGWTYTYINSENEEVEAAWTFDTQITGDVILTAKYHSESSLILRYVSEDADGNPVLIYTDPNIYDDGAETIITNQIPEGRFIGWKLANKPGTLYTAGDYIEVSTANDVLDGTPDTYVTLIAVYDEEPTTSITFDANGGLFSEVGDGGNTTASTTYVLNNLKNNEGVDLDTIPSPTRHGYNFLGWATSASAIIAEFEADGEDGTEEIAADSDGDNVLYAVWEEEFFYIYHSSTGATDRVSMTQTSAEGKYNIVAETNPDYYYGGYYKRYPGTWSTLFVYRENGETMTPVAGTTYYLKEVSKDYLKPAIYVTYNTYYGNEVTQMFLLTGVDDANYTDVGLKTTNLTTGERSLVSSYTITRSITSADGSESTETYVTLTTGSVWGNNVNGYLAVWDHTSDLKTFDEDAEFEYQPYFTTPDGVTVYGDKVRTVDVGDKHYYKNADDTLKFIAPGITYADVDVTTSGKDDD